MVTRKKCTSFTPQFPASQCLKILISLARSTQCYPIRRRTRFWCWLWSLESYTSRIVLYFQPKRQEDCVLGCTAWVSCYTLLIIYFWSNITAAEQKVVVYRHTYTPSLHLDLITHPMGKRSCSPPWRLNSGSWLLIKEKAKQSHHGAIRNTKTEVYVSNFMNIRTFWLI